MEEAALTIDAITLLLNLLIAIAAIAGAICAGMGLNTWKQEQKSRRETELARTLIILFHNYRDSLFKCRNIVISTIEISRAIGVVNAPLKDGEIPFETLEAVYRTRWEKVEDNCSKLYPLLIEADVIWNNVMKPQLAELWEQQNLLCCNIGKYLRENDPRYQKQVSKNPRTDPSFDKYLVFDHSFENDDFKKENKRILDPILQFLGRKCAGSK